MRAPFELATVRPRPGRGSVAAMSHRPEQVASVIRRAVQEQLSRGLHDPRIRGLVSITRVTVDADLSEARVFVSVLPEEHAKLSLQGLAAAASHLQRRAREGLPLRRMPRLSFVLDDSLKKAAESDAALARAAAVDLDASSAAAPFSGEGASGTSDDAPRRSDRAPGTNPPTPERRPPT